MSPVEAKLRRDLFVSEQKVDGKTTFVLKDPATSRFFRLKEAEYFIAKQLDGSTRLEAIRERVEKELGARLSPEILEEFIESLRRHGLLAELEQQRLHRREARLKGNILYLRLKAFDPDRFLERLLSWCGFCFRPFFVACAAIFVLFAFGIAVSNWSEIAADMARLLQLETLLWAWVAIVLLTAAHELAHGLVCKRFGGSVHELGFLLLYFQPALYVNVSEAWLFPEKGKRMWVTFAGSFFDLLAWSAAILVWRLTDEEAWVRSAALVVIGTLGIKVFFNMNPLLKLDGYYLLSDYLGIPNLREKAFGYLGGAFRRLWSSPHPGRERLTRREKLVYVAYGSLAGAYSVSLIGFLLVTTGDFLISTYQGAGLVAFTALLLGVFKNRIQKAFRLAPAILLMLGKGKFTSWKRLAKVLALIAVIASSAAALFLGRLEFKVSGSFKVLPTYNTEVQAEVEGFIDEIHVNEGDEVEERDLIASLSSRDYLAELMKNKAEVGEKRAKLKMLQAGPRPEEIALARARVQSAQTTKDHACKRYEEAAQMRAVRHAKAKATIQKAEERLEYARNDLERLKTLFLEGVIPKRELEGAEDLVSLRQKEKEEAQAEIDMVLADNLTEMRKEVAVAEEGLRETEAGLKLLLAGSRREEIEAAQAEIARLEAQQGYLEKQIQHLDVRSPVRGVITTPRLKEKIGRHVKKGEVIAEVDNLKAVKIEIAISEKDIGDVEVGQRVLLKARAYSQKTCQGRVDSIAPLAAEGGPGEGKTILVRTLLENASPFLRPEMTGMAKICCGDRTIMDILTRRIARYLRVEFWSWW